MFTPIENLRSFREFCAGGVCLNILREDWRPVLDVNAVIYGLIQLFGHDVNSEDPLNREAAALLQTDRTQVGGGSSCRVIREVTGCVMLALLTVSGGLDTSPCSLCAV